MQDRHAEEAHGGAGGPAGLTKEIIFGRIAAYEIAFGNRPNGRSSPTFIGYFSKDETVLLGFMGLNAVTDPARLRTYHKMEADRQGTDWFGPNAPRFAALGEKLPLFSYGVLAYGDGWVQSEDVSPLAIQSAVSRMRDSATGRAAIRAYDLEIVKVLKDRFLIHDFAQIMTVYGSVKFVPEEGAELSTDDMALQFVGEVIKATGLVDISKLSNESKEKIIEVLNKKIAEKNVALAGHMVDQTAREEASGVFGRHMGGGVDEEGIGCRRGGRCLLSTGSAHSTGGESAAPATVESDGGEDDCAAGTSDTAVPWRVRQLQSLRASGEGVHSNPAAGGQ